MSSKPSHPSRAEPAPRPHWTAQLAELRARMRQAPRLLIVSDFDGTLSELVDRPEQAALHADAPRVLKKLAALYPRVRLGFLSGRMLADLARRLDLDGEGIILGGNHGVELSGAGLDWTHPACLAARPRLEALAAELRKAAGGVSGVTIEDKGVSITLHYRRVSAARRPALHALIDALALPAGIQRHAGKSIIEFRPQIDWHKGRALRRIMQRLGMPASTVVYLGDDLTDEDAFRVLRSTGITVHVGPSSATSLARLHAHDPGDAVKFLKALADMLETADKVSSTPRRTPRPRRLGTARRGTGPAG